MKKISSVVLIFKIIILVLIVGIVINSCKKLDTRSINKNEVEFINEKFFAIPAGTNIYTQKVIKEIQLRNSKTEFVQDFAIKNGFPVWNKALLKERKIKKNGTSSFNSSNLDSMAQILYIPLVLQNTNIVNGFITAVINDSISIVYSLSKDYKAYSFASINNEPSEASKFAFLNIKLNQNVFGINIYNLNDDRLFSTDTITKHSKKIRFNNATTNLLTSICETVILDFGHCGSSVCQTTFGYCIDMDNCPTGECYSSILR